MGIPVQEAGWIGRELAEFQRYKGDLLHFQASRRWCMVHQLVTLSLKGIGSSPMTLGFVPDR